MIGQLQQDDTGINERKPLLPVIALLSTHLSGAVSSQNGKYQRNKRLRNVSKDVEDAVEELQILGEEQNTIEDCLTLAREPGKLDDMLFFDMMVERIEEQRPQ